MVHYWLVIATSAADMYKSLCLKVSVHSFVVIGMKTRDTLEYKMRVTVEGTIERRLERLSKEDDL